MKMCRAGRNQGCWQTNVNLTRSRSERDVEPLTTLSFSLSSSAYRVALRLMFSLRRLITLAVGLASLVSAKSSTGNSVLVVVEPKRQDDFSIFYDGLRGESF